jgi:hypothetical protein
MKRLSLGVAATMIAFAVSTNVHAGDKGNGLQRIGTMTATQGNSIKSMQGGNKSGAPSTGLQNTGIANRLQKQGNILQQNKSNIASSIKDKQLGTNQLMKKNGNGPQGAQQIMKNKMEPKMKEKHFAGIRERCYFGKDIKFWSEHRWSDQFGCYTYFCPTRHCWYFWYEPYACYLPVEYWSTYYEPVVEVSQPAVEVSQPVVEAPPVEVVQQPVQVVQQVIAVPTVRYVVRPYYVHVRPHFRHCGPTFFHHVRH